MKSFNLSLTDSWHARILSCILRPILSTLYGLQKVCHRMHGHKNSIPQTNNIRHFSDKILYFSKLAKIGWAVHPNSAPDGIDVPNSYLNPNRSGLSDSGSLIAQSVQSTDLCTRFNWKIVPMITYFAIWSVQNHVNTNHALTKKRGRRGNIKIQYCTRALRKCSNTYGMFFHHR